MRFCSVGENFQNGIIEIHIWILTEKKNNITKLTEGMEKFNPKYFMSLFLEKF